MIYLQLLLGFQDGYREEEEEEEEAVL